MNKLIRTIVNSKKERKPDLLFVRILSIYTGITNHNSRSLINLLSEGAALSELALASGRSAQHSGTAGAHNDSL